MCLGPLLAGACGELTHRRCESKGERDARREEQELYSLVEDTADRRAVERKGWVGIFQVDEQMDVPGLLSPCPCTQYDDGV